MNDMVVATRAWPRVKWTRAAQVAPLLGDTPTLEAVAAMSPSAAFAVLRASDPTGATHFMAQCLSRIDAVRWVLAGLVLVEPSPPPARAVAAKAVRRWVATPSDEARRLAQEAGAIAGWDTVEGLACLSVFLSGGSMAPAAQEIPVNPQPGIFGKVVASTILTAALAAGGAVFDERINALLDTADAIAAGEQTA